MNKQKKASLFLMIILVQYVLIGSSIVRANYNNSNDPEKSDIKISQNDGISHSSPYYFPTNQSTPLMTEGFQNEESENNAKSAPYYYNNDFVLTVNLDKYVLTIGETLTINLGLTCNLTASAGKTISVKIYQGLYRDYRWYYPDYYDTTTPVYSENVTTNNEGQASILFSSTSTAGLYTVYAYAEGYKTYKEFTIGEVGIFCKGPRYYKSNHKYTAAVHVVNLTDFSSIPLAAFNYSISYYEYSISNWFILTTGQVQTDDLGYAIFNADITLGVDDYHMLKLTVCTLDGKAEYQTFIYETWDYYYYCLWGGQQETNQERLQYVVTTDKTIYTPGENILLRVLVLEYSFMNETKRPLKHTPISLIIYNPDELAIFWSSLTTDENGIITFNFPLDEDCELGSYGFEFSKTDDNYRYNIKVEHYIKPVFRVEIDTNGKDFYPDNQQLFEGFVYASYYFGQPVVGAFVVLTIQNYWGDIKYTINGYTNGEGLFYFSIDLSSIEDLYYSFSVQADVTDNYGRSASTKKRYTRMEDLFAYGYLSNWAPHPDEYLEYYFYVYQYVLFEYDYLYWYWNYNPLSNVTVKIEIFGINGYPIYKCDIANEKLLATYFKTTNKFGSGKLEFKLPLEHIMLYDLYEIRLTVDLEDKRSTTSSYYYRYKKYSLDINIIDTTFDPGQTLEFNVSYKNVLTDAPCTGEGIIYIYDSYHQLVGRVCEKISGIKGYYFSIPNFYPEGIYYIYSFVYSRSNEYYGGFHYHSAHESFIVGSFQVISFDTNFTNTGIYHDEIVVQIGDIIEINGISNVSTNLPHYFEIYKRGLLFSIPIEVIDNKFSYILPVIADYAPDFTIIIYAISDLGKLYESVLAVHVEYSFSFELSTDKEIYEPGDSVTLTITPSENVTSIFALSFIDSAVLDVEPEDDSELAYFTMNTYATYISSGSSWGSGFDAGSYWWSWYGFPRGGVYNLDIYYPEPGMNPFFYDNLRSMENAPSFDDLITSFDTEIRKNITESANWMPRLIISEPTSITFKLPDNIGEWTIRAVGCRISDNSNSVVMGGDVVTVQIKAFLPFFIEFEIPQPVVQDDILCVKGYVYNYIGTTVRAIVAINAPNLIILNKDVQELVIPNGFVSEVEFSVYCIEPYFQNITLLAATEVSDKKYSDAKQVTTYIKPNGIEVVNRTIGFLNVSDGSVLLNYILDPFAIYHKETLSLYTDLMDIAIDCWQSLIGYPYGCIEQTISKVLPTALIFDYLNQTGQLTLNLEKQLTSMILEGLQRIYNFQHSDGGWGWWANDDSKILMTSIVVSALNQIEEVGFQINQIILQKGIEYLISHQQSNGVWDFQEYSSNTLEATAFILKAIMNYKNITPEINTAISKAVNEFMNLWNIGDMQSTYAASLFYIATKESIYENVPFNDDLIQYIKDNKKVEENTIFWESDSDNVWYWRKLGNKVEITSYAIWALALDDYINNYVLIQKAVRYLLNQRNRWGWRTTADTAAAITTLTAIKKIATNEGFIDFNGTISVNINNNDLPQFLLNFTEDNNHPNEILLNLGDYININSNIINISLIGSGQICYIFESIQILRSNPKIMIPEIIEVSKNQFFYLPMKFSEIDDRMPILDVSLSLTHVPQDLQDPNENYTASIPFLINGSEILFSLIAPNIDGDFIIEGVLISGFIQYLDASYNSSNYQLFQRTIGPMIIKVGTQSTSPVFNSQLNVDNIASSKSFPLIEGIHSSATNTSETLTLMKQVSKQNFLVPGELITTTITIFNEGDPRQFYVLEDDNPTGMIVLPDSVEISGDYENSEITHDLFLSGIHFFFPILATGITEITYQLQVDSIKNSYSGQCKLWGMYDDTCISTQSVVLENIPRKYYANHSVYQDLIGPSILEINVTQNQESSKIELQIDLIATDNNDISKIRIIFSQHSGWRAQTLYSMKNQEEFHVILFDFENVDSTVDIILEVFDAYGNIATSALISKQVIAYEIIPYIIIGIILGFSMGLASVFSILYKKLEKKKRSSQYRLIHKTKQEIRNISFIDESEENIEKFQENYRD